uniref:HMG box domain-containing protein n=1 Tax=Culex tarsalis TaxID=7177 RepID=A0A1Q3G061_CULTA
MAPTNNQPPNPVDQRLLALNRVGRISRAPFFNFVRTNRMRRPFPDMKTAVRQSALEWRSMTPDQKRPFQLEAESVPRNGNVPDYYRLGEHVLGKTVRGQLNLFKTKLDRVLDRQVAEILRRNAGRRGE